jgi:hypothetical protein
MAAPPPGKVSDLATTTDTSTGVQTVNGNSDNQSILIKPVYRNQVAYYYQVD